MPIIVWGEPHLRRILRSYANYYNNMRTHAIRDSEATDESAGVDSFRTRHGIYVLVAAATAMTGALIYLPKVRISPDAAFSVPDWSC